jgi:hypothetical protein
MQHMAGTGRPRGRRPIFGTAMTVAERKRRSRWMQAVLGKIIDRYKVQVQANWYRSGPPDILGRELAYATFDFDRRIPNSARWAEINAAVLKSLAELERDFAVL